MTAYQKLIPEHPRDVFNRGDQANVPLMMGSTKHDGSYVLGVVYNRFLKDNNLTEDATFLENEMIPSILRSLGITH
jgi:carboxylesterase type B